MSNILDELMGVVCPCGQRKKPKQTFCPFCYFALPRPMRQALYKPWGGGYEEAYLTAHDYLVKEGYIKQ